MKHPVNLDAHIQREDFQASIEAAPPPGEIFKELSVFELENAVGSILRKPDFQRETASWTPQRVMAFVQSLVDGDTVPSIILWRSPTTGSVFVIDGAHRLSAVLAWIKDDYGTGERSQKFFNYKIPPEQELASTETRDLITRYVGAYKTLVEARESADGHKDDHVRRGRNLLTYRIYVQWIHGNARNAEESFSKINQLAVPIDKTELKLIKARKKPMGLATRAILRAGAGYKYWKEFSEPVRTEIERLAREIYALMFEPAIKQPIKTLDLPVGGSGYSGSTMRLILEFVIFANKPQKSTPDDKTGEETIAYLQRTWRLVTRICGEDRASLGLHPAVYFYSRTGVAQPTAFLAIVRWIVDLESRDYFAKFTEVRKDFENFLVEHNSFVSEGIGKLGSGTRPMASLVKFYNTVLRLKTEGKSDAEIIVEITSDAGLKFAADALDSGGRKDFSREVKSAAFLRDALGSASFCRECGARIHPKSISWDHTLEKADGGKGDLDNAQMMHPYCNTGVKGRREAIARAKQPT